MNLAIFVTSFLSKIYVNGCSWGYMSSQIIGGRMAETFGFKIVYGLGNKKYIYYVIYNSINGNEITNCFYLNNKKLQKIFYRYIHTWIADDSAPNCSPH